MDPILQSIADSINHHTTAVHEQTKRLLDVEARLTEVEKALLEVSAKIAKRLDHMDYVLLELCKAVGKLTENPADDEPPDQSADDDADWWKGD